MSWLDCVAGTRHPDSMSRSDMIKTIQSFTDYAEAMKWWLKYASHKVSRKAFDQAFRGDLR